MDRISLKEALEYRLWEMVWAGEPDRKISVEMTYSDLKTIVECFFKAKPVPLGKYNSTEYASYYGHCPNCKSDIVRRFMKNNTYLKGKTYKEFCKNCGQLLEIPYV